MKTHGNMCTQPSPCEQAQAKKTPVGSKEEQPLFILNQKEQLWTHTKEPAFENGLKAVPSIFCHPLPDVNNAQGLSHQLKSKE